MHQVVRIEPEGVHSIRDVAPNGRFICRHNGAWRLRATWDVVPVVGDTLEFFQIAQDKEEFRTLLTIAAVAASAFLPGTQFAFLTPYIAGVSIAYNLLVPPSTPEPGEEARDIFAASVSGNTARLDQPIWRTFGIDFFNPPFAAIPYVEFRDDDGDNIDNEQYFYCILAVGYGPVDLLAEYLGKTPLNHYQDIIVHQLLQPGEQPTVALANVYTSPDIGNFELTPKVSVGSYVACPPDKTVEFIGVDIYTAGLGSINSSGDVESVEVRWTVQARRINAAGAPIGAFSTVAGGLETRTMATNSPQRWTGKYPISPPGRVEVRVIRTNPVDTGANSRDSINWVGLRGYSSEPAELNPNVSHYELVLRGSQQLSQSNQTDIKLLVQGKTRTWSPGGGWSCAIGDWENYTSNRSPAWALADLWSDPTWGEGLPDDRINLQGLYDFSLTNAERQDRCDYTFSSTTDAWSASQLLARTGRARVFRRYGVRTLSRDELAEAGETAFTPRMCRGGTQMTMAEKLPQGHDPDGVIAQYRSNVTWDTAVIECPCPGVSVTDPTDPRYDAGLPPMERPIYKSYAGVQGYTHALREGLYDAADMALRQRTVQFETEMQGVLASFLKPVRWLPQFPGYNQTGDVAFWDDDTLVMGLTEPPDWSRAPLYLTLRRDDGSLTNPVLVTAGPTAFDVTLLAAPDFALVLDDGTRERPVFLLGPLTGDEIVKVSEITDAGRGSNGAPFYSVTAVVDVPEVHTVDNAYLPGPGDDQDPVGLPGDYEGGSGTQIIVLDGGSYEFGQGISGGATSWTLTLTNAGAASITNDATATVIPFDRQWSTEVLELAEAALYEVYFAPANPYFDTYFTGSALRTWISLDTTRTWTLGGGGSSPVDREMVAVDVSIRLVSDGTVQAVGRYYVRLNIDDLNP